MTFLDNIKYAYINLKNNKLRSVMTMLGIIIGIGSVIAIVTVGNSITGSVNDSLKEMGGQNIQITIDSKDSYDFYNSSTDDYEYIESSVSPTDDDYMSLEMIADYQKTFKDSIEEISYSKQFMDITLTNKVKSAKVSVKGISLGYKTINKLTLKAGRWFTDEDMDKNRMVCLVNEDFVKSYFGNSKYDKAISKALSIEIGGQVLDFTIVGVYHYSSNNYMISDNELYIPVTTGIQCTGSKNTFSSIMVCPKDDIDVTKFTKQSDAYWKSYYLQNPRADARIYSDEEYTKSLNETMSSIQLGIGAIAAISLLVGGIGVMNIMMVSVTERTKEIGIRMALGAKRKEILLQFVTEAMLICLIGGILGILVGVGLGMVAANIMNYPARPSLPAILIAVGFSMFIGVFFGYYPAKKASNLDPIESLRYE